jgi:hypothetical protein
MSKPSTSSDLMKLIDDANRVTTVPEAEQWTIRGWPKGLAMFHKNDCRCCNEYVAHAVRACKNEGMNLPRQAVGHGVVTAWPELMRDLERHAEEKTLDEYRDLEDDIARLKTKLESSQAALASECSRVERRNETIRDLQSEIEALKCPQSTLSTTTSSTRPGAQASGSAGPSSRQMAPLPARAHSGLAARISQPGLASRMDAHPTADRFNDLPADDAPGPDESMPDGWSKPDWPSDDSMWKHMRGPDDPPKVLSKKRKKKGLTYEPYGLAAVHKGVMREYLVRSLTHTVEDEALTAELRSARRAYVLEQAELAKAVVIPTPQFPDLTVRTKYPGEGGPPHTRDGASAPPTRPLGTTNGRLGRCMSH